MAETEILERGNIFFFYRPRVETPEQHEEKVEEGQPEATGLEDVQRFYVVLDPHGKPHDRILVLGQKKLPAIRDGGERHWGFVEAIEEAAEVDEELDPETYETKTRGERYLPAARPAGEGVYAIVAHGDHTHLAYALELPEKPGDVQRELNIEPEASYILSVKNPDAPSPPGARLPEERKPEYPKRLVEVFRERRFAEANPPDFLDHEGTVVLLIGAAEDVHEDLGMDLDPQHETEATAEVFRKLRVEKSEHPTEPLFEGKWR